MKAGRLRVKVPQKDFVMEAGDCAAVNANILHYADTGEDCLLRSLVFHPRLTSGDSDFVFGKRYMEPLLSRGTFTGCLIPGEIREETAECFQSAFETMEGDAYGYEFIGRENLSRICLLLCRLFEQEIEARREGAIPAEGGSSGCWNTFIKILRMI